MSEGESALEPRGTLADRDVPHLIQELYRQAWTGSLALSHREARIGINVRQGQLVFASSSNPDHRLGPLLLRRGTVTARQLIDAGQAVVPGKRLGSILVERGILSSKELVRAVVDQTQEIIYHAFQWTKGNYVLQPGPESAESITLSISTPNIILEGIRRIESWARIERGIGGLEARYQQSAEGVVRAIEMSLSSAQRSLLEDLGAPRDVETLCDRSTLSDFEACGTLWAFAVVGVVNRLSAPPPAPPVDDEGLAYIAGEP
jgi:hypothetical protein